MKIFTCRRCKREVEYDDGMEAETCRGCGGPLRLRRVVPSSSESPRTLPNESGADMPRTEPLGQATPSQRLPNEDGERRSAKKLMGTGPAETDYADCWDICGAPVRLVMMDGQLIALCASCIASSGVCPFCQSGLGSDKAEQCPSCGASWGSPTLDTEDGALDFTAQSRQIQCSRCNAVFTPDRHTGSPQAWESFDVLYRIVRTPEQTRSLDLEGELLIWPNRIVLNKKRDPLSAGLFGLLPALFAALVGKAGGSPKVGNEYTVSSQESRAYCDEKRRVASIELSDGKWIAVRPRVRTKDFPRFLAALRGCLGERVSSAPLAKMRDSQRRMLIVLIILLALLAILLAILILYERQIQESWPRLRRP